MSNPKPYVHKDIIKALDDTGLPWRLDHGSRHWKIRVAGRMVGILPHGKVKDIAGHAVSNTICQIKRAVREAHTNDGVQL